VNVVAALPPPNDIPISILHSIFIKGQTIFELGEEDMEASRLYPDYEYTTIDQLLDIFLVNPPKPAAAAFGANDDDEDNRMKKLNAILKC
jgi:hypothetical protein